MKTLLRLSLLGMLGWLLTFPATAREIHVDNQNGNDANDGLTAESQTVLTGPVQSLRQALRLCRRGDTIILQNTGWPYTESLTLAGGHHSGFPNQPLTIVGNGAVLSGVAPVPTEGWQRATDGLWELTLTRKGYYRFFLDEAPVPEQQFATSTWTAADLPLNHWASHRGKVRFRLADDVSPLAQNWTYAAAEMGISLANVRNVRIENLTVVGYRFDGINADGDSREIVLDGVTLQHHGRAGLAIGGMSQVTAIDCQILDNGRASILITERGGAQLENCDLGGVEPTIQP